MGSPRIGEESGPSENDTTQESLPSLKVKSSEP